MMKNCYSLITFFLLLSFFSVVNAQLHIVKDHDLCKYGLKNEAGNWIVPPSYEYIMETYKSVGIGFYQEDVRYIVDDGAKRGLLSSEGQVLVPVIYDVVWENAGILHLRNDDLNGVSTLDGNTILPVEYRPINENNGLFFGYKHVNGDLEGPNTTTCADIRGTYYFKDLEGYVCCFENRKYAVLQKSYEQQDSELGVIDLYGKPVIPQIYDRILIGDDHFIVSKGGKTSILDVTGKEVMPEIASIHPTLGGSLSDPSMTYLVKNSDSLVGLLDSKFKQIFPMVHDSITSFPYSNTSVLKGQLFSKGKTGIFNFRHEMVIPLAYEDLKVIYSEGNSFIGKPSWFFLYRQNGKFGVLDFSGKKITEATYDLVKNDFTGREYEKLFLRNEQELFVFTDGGNISQKLTFQFRNRNKDYYRWENKLVELHDTTDREFTRVVGSYFGNLAFYNHWESRLFTSSGEELLKNKISKAEPLKDNYLSITTKSGNIGMMDNRSAQLIIDTIYKSYAMAGVLKSEILLMNANGKWVLYDTLGNRKLAVDLDQKETWFNEKENDSLILRKVVVNGRTGVLDKDYHFILDPVYENVGWIYPNYLVVITKSQRTGLFDSKGNMLVNTVYTDFLPVFANYHYSMDAREHPELKRESTYLFRNGDKRTWITSEGKKIVSSGSDKNAAVIDSLLYASSMQAYGMKLNEMNKWDFDFVPDGTQNVAYKAFKPFIGDQERALFAGFPCKNELYNLLKADYEEQLPAAEENLEICHGFTTRKGVKRSFALLEKKDLGKRYFSLHFTIVDHRSYRIGRLIENYLVDSCNFRKMEIGEIFTDTLSLRQELIKALEKRENLYFDCHSPNGLLQLIHFFSFTRDGIILYLANPETPEYPEIELLIPKENLLLYPSLKWIYPYLE